MKVLNLYSGLGGNRLLWDNCEVTAVEIDSELCRLYEKRFPNDYVLCGDAHAYLLNHFHEYDFIWSSPPCPSHSRARYWNTKCDIVYPDLRLYEEIILLENHFEGKYCVENVKPYYDLLIPGNIRGRHVFWTNFNLPYDLNARKNNFIGGLNEMEQLIRFHDYDFSQYKGHQRIDKIARNLVDYEIGKSIFDCVKGKYFKKSDQILLF